MALSKSAVDKLGERLRKGEASEDDWTLLEELRAERQRQLDAVVLRLRDELGLTATKRVKTTNTLVEKLQRESARLSQVDDVAGARIKVEGTRLDQDAVVQKLLELWPDARLKDRRIAPVHGYRAVHVIPNIEGWRLEIQVRSARQDAMANIFESLADVLGRQIRYGGAPEEPRDLPADMPMTAQEVLDLFLRFADVVAEFESIEAIVSQHGAVSPAIRDQLEVVARTVDGTIGMLVEALRVADG